MMKATEQTLQQIERAIRKVADKFPTNDESGILTDIHLRVTQDTGELVAFDDDDKEITRCIIEQWIENKDDNFYEDVAVVLRSVLSKQKDLIEKMVDFSSHTPSSWRMMTMSILPNYTWSMTTQQSSTKN